MKNLVLARKEIGLTQEELGNLVGVKKSAISKYENDLIQPSHEILIKLSKVLHVTTDYLLGINDAKKAPSEDEAIKKQAVIMTKGGEGQKVKVLTDKEWAIVDAMIDKLREEENK